MNTRLALLTLSGLTLAASTVRAEEPAPAEQPTVAATPTPPPKKGAEDPNIDRGFLLPTAMTQPAGSATYNNYELLLHGFTYAFTDNVQTTVTVLSPIVKDMPFFGVAAVKGRFNPAPRLHLALQGSMGYAHLFNSGSDANLGLFGGGGFASFCLREDCSSLLSASVTYQVGVTDGPSTNTAQMVFYGGSIVHSVSRHLKLLAELTSITVRNSRDDWDNMPGALASYGVRFHTADIAGDIGFIKPIGEDTGDFIMGLPFVNVSYRWQ